jgi:DUF4097 and DUF4098 domain-containing protein YvlB
MLTRRSLFSLLVLLGVILMASGAMFGQSDEGLRETFHKTLSFDIDGAISFQNYSGTVRFLVWDRNEIKVDAVKRAASRERFVEAEVQVEGDSQEVLIRTKYPETFCTCNNPATVDYTIMVPRKARLIGVNIVNGPLEIDGLGGSIRVSLINGHLKANGLKADAKINTVNGHLEVSFDRLGESQSVSLDSVNAPITLTIPPETSAQLKAVSQKGDISNDFGLIARKGENAGLGLMGNLGTGSAKLKLQSVKGNITIRRGQKIKAHSD